MEIRSVGRGVAKLHNGDVIHGDLTTSNMMLRLSSGGGDVDVGEVVMLDFGLSAVGSQHEDKAVDLYVLERAFSSTHADSKALVDEVPT